MLGGFLTTMSSCHGEDLRKFGVGVLSGCKEREGNRVLCGGEGEGQMGYGERK